MHQLVLGFGSSVSKCHHSMTSSDLPQALLTYFELNLLGLQVFEAANTCTQASLRIAIAAFCILIC